MKEDIKKLIIGPLEPIQQDIRIAYAVGQLQEISGEGNTEHNDRNDEVKLANELRTEVPRLKIELRNVKSTLVTALTAAVNLPASY